MMPSAIPCFGKIRRQHCMYPISQGIFLKRQFCKQGKRHANHVFHLILFSLIENVLFYSVLMLHYYLNNLLMSHSVGIWFASLLVVDSKIPRLRLITIRKMWISKWLHNQLPFLYTQLKERNPLDIWAIYPMSWGEEQLIPVIFIAGSWSDYFWIHACHQGYSIFKCLFEYSIDRVICYVSVLVWLRGELSNLLQRASEIDQVVGISSSTSSFWHIEML